MPRNPHKKLILYRNVAILPELFQVPWPSVGSSLNGSCARQSATFAVVKIALPFYTRAFTVLHAVDLTIAISPSGNWHSMNRRRRNRRSYDFAWFMKTFECENHYVYKWACVVLSGITMNNMLKCLGLVNGVIECRHKPTRCIHCREWLSPTKFHFGIISQCVCVRVVYCWLASRYVQVCILLRRYCDNKARLSLPGKSCRKTAKQAFHNVTNFKWHSYVTDEDKCNDTHTVGSHPKEFAETRHCRVDGLRGAGRCGPEKWLATRNKAAREHRKYHNA